MCQTVAGDPMSSRPLQKRHFHSKRLLVVEEAVVEVKVEALTKATKEAVDIKEEEEAVIKEEEVDITPNHNLSPNLSGMDEDHYRGQVGLVPTNIVHNMNEVIIVRHLITSKRHHTIRVGPKAGIRVKINSHISSQLDINNKAAELVINNSNHTTNTIVEVTIINRINIIEGEAATEEAVVEGIGGDTNLNYQLFL